MVSVQGWSLSRGGLCPGVVSVQGSLSRGVSVQGGLCPGVPLSRGSLSRGWSLFKGSLCHRGSLCGGLCPGGSMSRGVSVQGVSVQGVFSVQGWSLSKGVSVQWVSVQGGGLCPSLVSVSGGFLSGGLCLGDSLSREGVSVKGGGLCQGRSLCRGSPSGGSHSRGVSVQGGLCPDGEGDLCSDGKGDFCPGGSLSGRFPFRVSVAGGLYHGDPPRTVTSGKGKEFQSGINEHSLTIFSRTHIFRTQMLMFIFISLPDIKIHKELFTDFGNFQFFN